MPDVNQFQIMISAVAIDKPADKDPEFAAPAIGCGLNPKDAQESSLLKAEMDLLSPHKKTKLKNKQVKSNPKANNNSIA